MENKEILSWDEYFMSLAMLSAKRSKDPNTQVGSVIVDENNVLVSMGYNGLPRGVEGNFPWNREGEFEDTKYPYVVHSELNAILNSKTTNLKNCKIYVALFPCNECAKAIIQSGIKHVYYLCDKHHDEPIYRVSRKLLDSAGVKYTQLDFGNKEIVISLDKNKI